MSGSILCTGRVSQGTGCELSSCGYSRENPNIEHKQSACCYMKESIIIVSEDLNISSVGEEDAGIVPNVELNVEGRVKNQVCHIQLSAVSTSSDEDVHNICHEFIESLSLGAKARKCLSRDVQEPSLFTNKRADSLGAKDQDYSASGISTNSRPISLSSSSTLVSAMKGGRALKGGMIKSELCVRWAPQVYDPPSTSMSHTVNAHHQRFKAKKKDKLKNKGKSERRNGGEKKHRNWKSFNQTPEHRNLRLHGNGLDGFGKSKLPDIFEYGINSQEVKCGSSFLKCIS